EAETEDASPPRPRVSASTRFLRLLRLASNGLDSWAMNVLRIGAGAAVCVGLVAFRADNDDVVGLVQSVLVPMFEYDPTFPKPLPETWAIGPIGGLAVDRQDHLFVVQRPGGLLANERFSGANANPPKADCCIPAPPVLEFDQTGKLVNSWAGKGEG